PGDRAVQKLQTLQVFAQLVGDVGITGLEPGAIKRLPRLQRGQIFFQRLREAGIFVTLSSPSSDGWGVLDERGVVGHGTLFKVERKRCRARVQSFLTESRLRSMRWATSGKLRLSRCRRISTSR